MNRNSLGLGAPDFARSVERVDLINASLAGGRPLVVIAAPSGYGKSVLSAQIASSAVFASSVWMELAGPTQSDATLLESVRSRLLPKVAAGGTAIPADAPMATQDILEEIERGIIPDALGGLRMCLVLDDVSFGEDETRARELGVLVSQLAPRGVTVVVTTRRAAIQQMGAVGVSAEILDADDLRISQDEAFVLAEEIGASGIDPERLESLVADCSGHAATLSMLIRHGVLRGFEDERFWASTGLRTLVHRAVSELPAALKCSLVGMALLSSGTDADLAQAGYRCSLPEATEVSAALPLISLSASGGFFRFRVHDSVQDAVLDDSVATADAAAARLVLENRGDLERAAWLVQRFGSEADRCAWIEDFGEEMLSRGLHRVLFGALDAVPVGVMLSRPRLMLLSAKALMEGGQQEAAQAKSAVARSLADHGDDHVTAAEALLIQALLHGDMGRMDLREQGLREFIETYRVLAPVESLAWAHSALAGTLTTSNGTDAVRHQEEAELLARRVPGSTRLKAKLLANGAAVDALVKGDWRSATRQTLELAELPGVLASERSKALGNAAVGLCETGRLERCLEVCIESLDLASDTENDVFRGSYLPVQGAAQIALGDIVAGESLMREGIVISERAGDRYGAEYSRVYLATALRAARRGTESLEAAERAFEFFSMTGSAVMGLLAQIELAASLLACGEGSSATRILGPAAPSGNPYHLLRADMILAEIARREGRLDDAVGIIAAHEDYILSESSNWQIAMYCRAFPELLGVFAMAIDPDRLPVHMLRMILPDNAERTLIACRGWLEQSRWKQLGIRLLGDEEFESFVERDGRPLCRVRLFGGLEVSVGGRVVSDKEWKKRKARLLFAMLVSRHGHDVPRDQILEYLWPEMDEDRARNNLYVVWSAMKGALLGDGDKAAHLPYVENSRGMCRVNSDAVRSDVDEFERRIAEASAATEAGDSAAALTAYRELSELYRGELLPGDIYDDWFAEEREHYKVEFVAAMRRAAELCAERNELGAALHYVRRAVQADPWQEDLYQLALRCQIAAGQRGAAIETYMQCRTRLAEDLGLDPSVETRALYDQILAMEDRPMPLDYFEALD